MKQFGNYLSTVNLNILYMFANREREREREREKKKGSVNEMVSLLGSEVYCPEFESKTKINKSRRRYVR